ncbi:hypothetical protein HRbin39_00458 [bacterium HR39]|nr:hypothetical protein HRbin39_00458 [bacterium HR39]
MEHACGRSEGNLYAPTPSPLPPAALPDASTMSRSAHRGKSQELSAALSPPVFDGASTDRRTGQARKRTAGRGSRHLCSHDVGDSAPRSADGGEGAAAPRSRAAFSTVRTMARECQRPVKGGQAVRGACRFGGRSACGTCRTPAGARPFTSPRRLRAGIRGRWERGGRGSRDGRRSAGSPPRRLPSGHRVRPCRSTTGRSSNTRRGSSNGSRPTALSCDCRRMTTIRRQQARACAGRGQCHPMLAQRLGRSCTASCVGTA